MPRLRLLCVFFYPISCRGILLRLGTRLLAAGLDSVLQGNLTTQPVLFELLWSSFVGQILSQIAYTRLSDVQKQPF